MTLFLHYIFVISPKLIKRLSRHAYFICSHQYYETGRNMKARIIVKACRFSLNTTSLYRNTKNSSNLLQCLIGQLHTGARFTCIASWSAKEQFIVSCEPFRLIQFPWNWRLMIHLKRYAFALMRLHLSPLCAKLNALPNSVIILTARNSAFSWTI